MVTPNRAEIFSNLHKVLKKHFEPVVTAQRSVIENLLYACCLEDAPYEAANDCFARIQESYFDWNEVRVTTVRELGELFKGIANPTANALNLKNTLQSVFESQYSFDLEPLKKQNLGKAVALLESYKGTTQFSVAYVTQMNLGGHSIPLGKSGVDIMYIIGAINEKEASEGAVPGLERAIPKTKGLEFASLMHQFSVELLASPFSQKVKAIFLEVAPDCKDRLPKRADKKKLEAEEQRKEEEAQKKIAEAREKQEEEALVAAKKIADKKRAEEKRATKKAAAKKVVEPKAAASKASATDAEAPTKKKKKVVKSTVKKSSTKDSETKTTAKKKTTKKAAASASAEESVEATDAADDAADAPKKKAKKGLVKKATKKTSKKSTSKLLARRKPR